MYGFGMQELVLIFAVLMLLFGAKKLPELGRGLGAGIREFKGSMKEVQSLVNRDWEDDEPKSLKSGDDG